MRVGANDRKTPMRVMIYDIIDYKHITTHMTWKDGVEYKQQIEAAHVK